MSNSTNTITFNLNPPVPAFQAPPAVPNPTPKWPFERIYIVAGTHEEFKEYIAKKRREWHNETHKESLFPVYTFVWQTETLRGLENPKGFFIGSWRKRVDIQEIKTTIAMSKR